MDGLWKKAEWQIMNVHVIKIEQSYDMGSQQNVPRKRFLDQKVWDYKKSIKW